MPKASGEKLVIGTLANWVGLPAWYAYAEGYYEEVGLDVEIVNFGSQGTLVNEAMAADECDIAVSGMASVYALSTGMYKYIGDGCLTISGETLYGRRVDRRVREGRRRCERCLWQCRCIKRCGYPWADEYNCSDERHRIYAVFRH